MPKSRILLGGLAAITLIVGAPAQARILPGKPVDALMTSQQWAALEKSHARQASDLSRDQTLSRSDGGLSVSSITTNRTLRVTAERTRARLAKAAGQATAAVEAARAGNATADALLRAEAARNAAVAAYAHETRLNEGPDRRT